MFGPIFSPNHHRFIRKKNRRQNIDASHNSEIGEGKTCNDVPFNQTEEKTDQKKNNGTYINYFMNKF